MAGSRCGRTSYRACYDNRSAAEGFWNTLTELLSKGLSFLVWVVLLSGLNPLLLCVIGVTCGAGYGLGRIVGGWGWRHRRKEGECHRKMANIRQVATGRLYAKDIRIFGLRPWLEQVWDNGFFQYRRFLGQRARVYMGGDFGEATLAFVRSGVIFSYLLWLTQKEEFGVSDFFLYFTAANSFTVWITGILDNLSLLHRQSLELSVMGLNGAGKTTLIKLICSFLDPTEGWGLLNGQDIRQYNRRDYYELFSVVFQDFSVLEANVAENVAQRVDGIDMERVKTCVDMACLSERVEALPQGLFTKIGRQVYKDGVELSGGQTQRLMLARALYKDAPILVLDEPTAAWTRWLRRRFMSGSTISPGTGRRFISATDWLPANSATGLRCFTRGRWCRWGVMRC